MKKILLALLVVVFCAACSEETTEPKDQPSELLLDPSTGWQHVMTIPYEKDPAAREGNDWITAYDMTQVNDEIGVLYSANYYLGEKGPIRQFYKSIFKENDFNPGSGTKLKIMGTTSRTTFHSQLIPKSLIPVFINFAGTDAIELYDENDAKMAMMLTNKAQEINYNYTVDGNFLAAGLDVPYASHFWNVQYPKTVFSLTDIKAAKNRGSFKTDMVIPMKLSDGNYYTMSIGKEGAKTSYQVLKLLPDLDYNIEINYEIVKQGELAGLPIKSLRSPSQSLVAYTVEEDVLTFVLADFPNVNASKINKLHCYRWNKMSNALTTLWESEEIGLNFSKGILDNKRAEYRYRENRLTRDGTFYTLFTKDKFAEPDNGTQYTILYTVNVSGIHESGRLDELYGDSVVITTCRYIKDAFYALVYPWNDSQLKEGDPKFHLEVVKLNL